MQDCISLFYKTAMELTEFQQNFLEQFQVKLLNRILKNDNMPSVLWSLNYWVWWLSKALNFSYDIYLFFSPINSISPCWNIYSARCLIQHKIEYFNCYLQNRNGQLIEIVMVCAHWVVILDRKFQTGAILISIVLPEEVR